MGWGDAKQTLYEKIDEVVAPLREKYDALIEDRDALDRLLKQGGEKARELSSRKMKAVREAVGIAMRGE